MSVGLREGEEESVAIFRHVCVGRSKRARRLSLQAGLAGASGYLTCLER